MHTWEEELQAYRRRTKKSARAWEAAKRHIPFGVNSNYRVVDPYPMYVRKARGSRLWDVDGNEYVDFTMTFGALCPGHSHPVLAKAMRERVSNGTIFGYESVDAGRLADHLCGRFHLDRLKFSMTGLDATLFAVRLARAVTGRRRILKFEGCYHGSHDSLMVSIKPRKELSGDPKHPNVVPSSKGLLKELVETAIVAPFNDIDATESLALLHRDDVAGIILEPVPMNMGYVQPEPGFLEGVRAVVDVGRWWGYYTAMLNRGVIPMATGADEQWTTSVAHTQADVARHLDTFEEVAEGMKQKQADMSIVEAI